MFGWSGAYNAKPIGHRDDDGYDLRDYTYESDGLHAALEESYRDLAEINAMEAKFNTRCVNVYANEYHKTGSHEAALEAVNDFEHYVYVKEGFLGDIKDKLIKLLTAIKDKIIAFFKSAVKYFNEFFMDADKFASKYEDELSNKDLDGFKYKVFEYKVGSGLGKDLSKTYEDMVKKVKDHVKKFSQNGGLQYVIDSYNNIDSYSLSEILYEWWIVNNLGHIVEIQTPNKPNVGDNIDGYIVKYVSPNDKIKAIEFRDDYLNSLHDDDDDGDDDVNQSPPIQQQPSSINYADKLTSSQHKEIKNLCYHILLTGQASDGAISVENFKKNLRKRLQGDRNEPKEIDFSSGVDHIVDALKNYKDLVQDIDDARDAMITEYDAIKDKLESVRDAEKAKEDAKQDKMKLNVAKLSLAVINDVRQVFTTYFDVYAAVVKERTSAYKSCIGAALHYKAKK